MSTDTFQDFCQAWTSRFPDSELPEAWEQDVRNNLTKHRGRVNQLREELEKEEMYVEYLEKLLSDIELHRSKCKDQDNGKKSNHHDIDKDGCKSDEVGKVNGDSGRGDADDRLQFLEGTGRGGDDRLQFLEDQCKLQANLRSSLHLDLNAIESLSMSRSTQDKKSSNTDKKSSNSQENKKGSKTGFITVINVKSPGAKGGNGPATSDQSNKKCSPDLIKDATASLGAASRFNFDPSDGGRSGDFTIGSQESLNSVSSPMSPTSSPMESLVLESLLSPREAPASPRDQFAEACSSNSEPEESAADHSPASSGLAGACGGLSRVKPDPPLRTVSVRNGGGSDETSETKSSNSSCEDLHSFQSRGRPDGGEEEDLASSLPVASVSVSISPPILPPNHPAPTFTTFTKPVKPPIAAKPDAARRGSLSSKDRRESAVLVGGKDRRELELPERQDEAPLSPPVVKRESKTRQNSNSSRGRMGSPGGKSQDSSDQDSWGRRQQLAAKLSNTTDSDLSVKSASGADAETSPVSKRRVSGETRLDRLVRRPSLEKPRPEARISTLERSRPLNADARPLKPLGVSLKSIAPPLPKPRKLKQAKETEDKESVKSEPLYDAVCGDEPEDEYDNHLLYGTNPNKGSREANGLDDSLASKDSGKLDSSTLSSSTDLDFSSSPSLAKKVSEMDEDESNYVNIQYFLHHTRTSKIDRQDSSGLLDASEDELTSVKSNQSKSSLDARSMDARSLDSKSGRSLDSKSVRSNDSKSGSLESKTGSNPAAETERLKMQTHILQSILDSEAIYLECLSVCLQYMKAMKVTLTTPSPIIPKDEFDIIFYKVPELYEFHHHFYENLKKQVDRWTGEEKIGHHFKMLAQQSKIYAQYLKNYPKALDTLHRCSQQYQKFADLTGSIKLRTLKGQNQGQSVSLEDLLHKPVARVQKNCMSLQDLIKHTPETSADHANLSESLSLMQEFLNVYNLEHRGELYPHHERTSRHLVKNSFIVELSEGVRKLRHLFLFNDVLVCAKYKATSRGERFTFMLKWYIPLSEALIVEEPSMEPKELKPANIVGLKTSAAAIRDQIIQVQRDEDWRGRAGRTRSNLDKPRKQLAELEAQLVLASPHLLLQVSSKSGKTFSFYLSSEFERAQWVETLRTLQSSLPPNTSQAHTLSMVELQAWISSCRKFLKTNMGSFLMRSTRDEPLLVGDLQLVIKSISGLTRPCSLYVVAEIDSYGHFFRKIKSRVSEASLEPVWNEECLIELEGSENLRLLVYQESEGEGVGHRGRACLELSRSWLTQHYTTQKISLGDLILTCELRFIGYEETTRRVPQSKPAGLFKTQIQQTTKKEKRAVPFIITSCVREVERRGINEVGIYRVSGSSADMARLKKAYETNPYEAEQLLKECDIHSVAGILKQYLRDLPESLFTNAVYYKLLQAYSIPDEELRTKTYLGLLTRLPQNPNQACVVFLIEHLVRVSQFEYQNKMSLHNMATVFGPTMLFPGQDSDKKSMEQLATSTVDVMAQSGILHFFLTRRARGEPIQISS